MFGVVCYNQKIQFMVRRVISESNLANTKRKPSKRWDDVCLPIIAMFFSNRHHRWTVPKSLLVRFPHTHTQTFTDCCESQSYGFHILHRPMSYVPQFIFATNRSHVRMLVCGDGQWRDDSFMWLWKSIRPSRTVFLFRICSAKICLFRFTRWWWFRLLFAVFGNLEEGINNEGPPERKNITLVHWTINTVRCTPSKRKIRHLNSTIIGWDVFFTGFFVFSPRQFGGVSVWWCTNAWSYKTPKN